MSEATNDRELCGAVKRGVVDLRCGGPKDHPGPHEAEFRDERTVRYPGSYHKITVVEEVTWQRTDPFREIADRIVIERGRA